MPAAPLAASDAPPAFVRGRAARAAALQTGTARTEPPRFSHSRLLSTMVDTHRDGRFRPGVARIDQLLTRRTNPADVLAAGNILQFAFQFEAPPAHVEHALKAAVVHAMLASREHGLVTAQAGEAVRREMASDMRAMVGGALEQRRQGAFSVHADYAVPASVGPGRSCTAALMTMRFQQPDEPDITRQGRHVAANVQAYLDLRTEVATALLSQRGEPADPETLLGEIMAHQHEPALRERLVTFPMQQVVKDFARFSRGTLNLFGPGMQCTSFDIVHGEEGCKVRPHGAVRRLMELARTWERDASQAEVTHRFLRVMDAYRIDHVENNRSARAPVQQQIRHA